MDDLRSIVGHEIEFQVRLWQGDYSEALASAESALGGLESSELRGYRALWQYLAGAAAWLGAKMGGISGLSAKSRLHFDAAKDAASGIAWLVRLSRYQSGHATVVGEDIALLEQIERVEAVLEQLGTVHDRSFVRREKQMISIL